MAATNANTTASANVAHKKRIRMAIDPDEMTEPTFDVDYPHDARKLDIIQKNPLVPAGALVTAGVLGAGLLAFKNGSQKWSQRLMRGRVIAQGATLCVLMYSVWDKARAAAVTSTSPATATETVGVGFATASAGAVSTHGNETTA